MKPVSQQQNFKVEYSTFTILTTLFNRISTDNFYNGFENCIYMKMKPVSQQQNFKVEYSTFRLFTIYHEVMSVLNPKEWHVTITELRYARLKTVWLPASYTWMKVFKN